MAEKTVEDSRVLLSSYCCQPIEKHLALMANTHPCLYCIDILNGGDFRYSARFGQ